MQHFLRYTMVQSSTVGLAALASVSLSACGQHSAHVDLWVWGATAYDSHLGYATTAASPVTELRHVAAIGAGSADAYVALSSGTVWGFGANDRGQLGTGQTSTTPMSAPVQIGGLASVSAVDGGNQFALALCADGTVWAWGQGDAGQLGDGAVPGSGDVALRPLPVRGPGGVRHIQNIVAVAAGAALSMAVDTGGAVWTWGSGSQGALGTGSTALVQGAVSVPVQAALSHIVAIAAGSDFGAALDADGAVWTWGQDASGELGTATAGSPSRALPQRVPGLGRITAIAVGYDSTKNTNHVVVAAADGTVWGWGANDAGQVGDGTRTNRSVPVQVLGVHHAVQVAAGPASSLAATDDGSVWAWGSDANNGLGDGPMGSSLQPVQVQETFDGSAYGPLQHVTALACDGTVCLAH